MLTRHTFKVLAPFMLVLALAPASSCAREGGYATAAKAIYPANYQKRPIRGRDYHALYQSMHHYLGDRFKVHDSRCLGATVPLEKEADTLFARQSQLAGSIDTDTFFTWNTMLHGGMCQTGVVFTSDMQVKLVATYRGGSSASDAKDFSPNVLSVYVKHRDALKYLPVLKRWAAFEARTFAASDTQASKGVDTRIYDLHCKTNHARLDVPACRMHLDQR